MAFPVSFEGSIEDKALVSHVPVKMRLPSCLPPPVFASIAQLIWLQSPLLPPLCPPAHSDSGLDADSRSWRRVANRLRTEALEVLRQLELDTEEMNDLLVPWSRDFGDGDGRSKGFT